MMFMMTLNKSGKRMSEASTSVDLCPEFCNNPVKCENGHITETKSSTNRSGERIIIRQVRIVERLWRINTLRFLKKILREKSNFGKGVALQRSPFRSFDGLKLSSSLELATIVFSKQYPIIGDQVVVIPLYMTGHQNNTITC